MNFHSFDRLPVIEWAEWWGQTIARWHTEGLPSSLTDRYDICRHFGLDIFLQDWFPVTLPTCPAPSSHGAGIIASEREYEQVLPHLYPADAVDLRRWEKWAAEQEKGDVVLWFTIEGFFWFPRRLLGIERHLYAFYDQPGLLRRINSDLSEWMLRTIDRLFSVCVPDFMTFAEDLSYNNGPMLSEEAFNEFMRPYYKLVVPVLKKRGVIPMIDSDGDVTIASDWFWQAGLEGILPLERQAGVDIAVLQKRHPRMRFIGHFDKMTMDKGEKRMREEFERLLPAAARGGFLIGCDHQTPPGVSYADYKLYVSLFREYAQEAGKLSARMCTRV